MRASVRSVQVVGAWLTAALLFPTLFAAGTPGVNSVVDRCTQETLECRERFADVPSLRDECGYCAMSVIVLASYTYGGAMLSSLLAGLPCLLFTLRRDRAARIALRVVSVLVLGVVLFIAYLQHLYLT